MRNQLNTILALSIPLTFACSSEEPATEPGNIVEIAQGDSGLTTLVQLIGDAGLADTLSGPGPFTVFAPTDAAFAKVPSSVLDALGADRAALADVLQFHVVSGTVKAEQVVGLTEATAVNGDKFTIRVEAGNVIITDGQGNDSMVTQTDIEAENGVIHLIDTVLLPPEEAQAKNLVEVATEVGSFGTLLSAATSAGLADTLSNAGPFTVFAPTDAAFSALGVDLSPVSTDVIGNILLHHVVAGSQESGAVVGTSALTSLAKLSLAVDAQASPITIGGANLSETLDVSASNGIIHVMDQVIVPPTILEVAQATEDLSTLVTAVGAASASVQGALAPDTLMGDSPITVFAPTNAAFMASGIDLGSVEQSALDGVLAHHVVGAQAVSSSLSDGQVVTTLNGDITVNIASDGAISITDGAGNTANVIATLADIRSLTGVVHVIDAVLTPAAAP